MKRTSSTVLQADARGRIQLPRDCRKFQFFRLSTDDRGCIILEPMVMNPVSDDGTSFVQSPWLNSDVEAWVRSVFIPEIQDRLKDLKEPLIDAVVLFGSRARASALTSSDFDLAVFVSKSASMKERQLWSENLDRATADLRMQLSKHGITGDFSWNFIPTQFSETQAPSLFLSLAEEGRVLYERDHCFSQWKRAVKRWMKIHKAKVTGEGKSRIWTWRTNRNG